MPPRRTSARRADDADADSADRWVANPSAEKTEPIEYDGQTVERSVFATEPSRRVWYFAIPAAHGQFHLTNVNMVADDDEYPDCLDEAVSVAEAVMESMRPNPAR